MMAHADRSGPTGVLALLGVLLVFSLLVPASEGRAQSGIAESIVDWDAERVHMTREGLEGLLQRLEEAAASSAYSSRLRDQARAQAAIVRQRLEQGDFRVGDQVVLHVRNEPDLSETFTVLSGRVLDLPLVGEVPMHGVLRSEVDEHLTEQIGQYLREPVVRAEALMRISVAGEVGDPGFYVVSADALVTDVLMEAGGPTREARLDAIEIQRAGSAIWADDAMEEAVIQGRTLDQLNLRAGDRIVVPRRAHRDRWELARNVSMVLGTSVSLIWAVSRFF